MRINVQDLHAENMLTVNDCINQKSLRDLEGLKAFTPQRRSRSTRKVGRLTVNLMTSQSQPCCTPKSCVREFQWPLYKVKLGKMSCSLSDPTEFPIEDLRRYRCSETHRRKPIFGTREVGNIISHLRPQSAPHVMHNLTD